MGTHWLWKSEDMEATPSIRAGMTAEHELEMRKEGVQMIKEIGMAIGLKTNPTLATACVFFHRFYMFESFLDYSPLMMALTCLFLAGKVEETPKKCKDLVHYGKRKYPKLFGGENAQDELILLERILLQTIRFDLHIVHPYKFLVPYAKGFGLSKEHMIKIITNAWTFINDSLASNLCLLWEPEVIAIAILYMSRKMTLMEFHSSPESGRNLEWWDNHVSNLTISMIEQICHKVLDCLNDEDEPLSPTETPGS